VSWSGVTALLPIVYPYGALFFKFEARQKPIFVSDGMSHLTQEVQIQKSASNCIYYLQRAITLDWMGCIAPWHFFKGGETF
jgi:hypothetical protein